MVPVCWGVFCRLKLGLKTCKKIKIKIEFDSNFHFYQKKYPYSINLIIVSVILGFYKKKKNTVKSLTFYLQCKRPINHGTWAPMKLCIITLSIQFFTDHSSSNFRKKKKRTSSVMGSCFNSRGSCNRLQIDILSQKKSCLHISGRFRRIRGKSTPTSHLAVLKRISFRWSKLH